MANATTNLFLLLSQHRLTVCLFRSAGYITSYTVGMHQRGPASEAAAAAAWPRHCKYPVAACWPLNGAERSFRCPAPERARSVRCKVLLLS